MATSTADMLKTPTASRRRSGRAVGSSAWLLVLACALSLVSPSSASAQVRKKAPATTAPIESSEEPATGAEAQGAQPARVKVERGAGGKKVYKIEGEIIIEGKIQKPEAFYVLQKSSINYDWHELKQEFVPRILDSVSKSPF